MEILPKVEWPPEDVAAVRGRISGWHLHALRLAPLTHLDEDVAELTDRGVAPA